MFLKQTAFPMLFWLFQRNLAHESSTHHARYSHSLREWAGLAAFKNSYMSWRNSFMSRREMARWQPGAFLRVACPLHGVWAAPSFGLFVSVSVVLGQWEHSLSHSRFALQICMVPTIRLSTLLLNILIVSTLLLQMRLNKWTPCSGVPKKYSSFLPRGKIVFVCPPNSAIWLAGAICQLNRI